MTTPAHLSVKIALLGQSLLLFACGAAPLPTASVEVLPGTQTPDNVAGVDADGITEGTAVDEALFQRAMQSFYEGDFEAAVTTFDYLWREYPESPRHDNAGYMSGRCRYELALYGQAVTALNMMLVAHPDSEFVPSALFYRGMSEMGLEEFEAAADSMREVFGFRDSPYADDAHFYAGYCYYALLDYPRALADFQVLLNTFEASDYADDALYYQVRIYTEQGNCQQAGRSRDELASDYGGSEFVTEASSYMRDNGC